MLAQGRALPGASEGYEPGLRQSFPGVQKLPKPPEPFRPCTTDPRPSPAVQLRDGMRGRRGLRQSWTGLEHRQPHGHPPPASYYPPHGLPAGAGPADGAGPAGCACLAVAAATCRLCCCNAGGCCPCLLLLVQTLT